MKKLNEMIFAATTEMRSGRFASLIVNAPAVRMKEKRKVKYPWLRRAAAEMGYDFSYLWRVLEGKPGFKGRKGLEQEYWYVSNRITRERDARRKSAAV